MRYDCASCQVAVDHDEAKVRRALPVGWALFRVSGMNCMLCPWCHPDRNSRRLTPHAHRNLEMRLGVEIGDDDVTRLDAE